jgi:hypothetical protein
MVTEVVMKRLSMLEQEKERILLSKQLVVRKNPLLDQRDTAHMQQNARLIDRTPTNM